MTATGRALAKLAGSADRGNRETCFVGGVQQRSISRHDNEIRVADAVGRREVDGVVAPEAVRLRELSGAERELFIDLDEVELVVALAELLDGRSKLAGGQPSEAVSLGESGPAFRVHETSADHAICCVPQLRDTRRAGLGNEQGNDGGRVEVGDHRR